MLYEPPPSANEMLRGFVGWVALLYRVKITYTLEEDDGVSTVVIDKLEKKLHDPQRQWFDPNHHGRGGI